MAEPTSGPGTGPVAEPVSGQAAVTGADAVTGARAEPVAGMEPEAGAVEDVVTGTGTSAEPVNGPAVGTDAEDPATAGPPGGRHRRAALSRLAVAAAGVLALAACSVPGEEPSVLEGDGLTVGVKFDQPGLGLAEDDGFSGFDVDVAHYLAERMGFTPDEVEVVGVTSAEREEKIIGGEVDMVVATYSITPERKTEVTFGGPYYVTEQDMLVRADDTRIETVRDLEGLTVCQGEGSYSASRITEGLGIDANVADAPSYSHCIDRLGDGSADAMATDALILAGYLAEDPSAFRFVGSPFAQEKYGVGLPHGDVEACEAVNKAINEMYQDGTAEELLAEWFGSTGLEVGGSVPQFEGCD